jgi:hypothetical protein
MTPSQALRHVWILKGLPPQVLVNHQRMHEISTPELPPQILKQRNQFLGITQKQQVQTNTAGKSPIKSQRPKIMISTQPVTHAP